MSVGVSFFDDLALGLASRSCPPDRLHDVRLDEDAAVHHRAYACASWIGVTATPWPNEPLARSIWRHGVTAGSLDEAGHLAGDVDPGLRAEAELAATSS